MEDQLSLNLDFDERMVLQDALAEFIAARGPTVTAYVNRRYPLDQGYTRGFRAEKDKSVTKNLALATKLREVLFTK